MNATEDLRLRIDKFIGDATKISDHYPPTAGDRPGPAIMRAIQHFIITIEGPGWEDFEDVELLQLPGEGEPIETKYGTCFVTQADPLPDTEHYDGKIVCRLP
jgi:hypothetical protein